MTYENIKVDFKDNILFLTINREKALNALNGRTMTELHHFFYETAPNNTAARGIIITGAGEKAFIAGADIKEFLELDAEKGAEMSRFGQEVFYFIERFPKPVIAAVNGFALGGGCELAMACHIRIAGEKARFGQPEVNLGIIPGYGGTQRLIQLIGKGKATEFLMTGDMIGAEEAHRLGLVNYVVPQGEEVAKAVELIEKIASKAPLAIAKVIECVNAYFDKKVDGFDFEVNEFGKLTNTEDFKEGATAFVERRTPNFKGK
jgi:enoyl-CoA hydratase